MTNVLVKTWKNENERIELLEYFQLKALKSPDNDFIKKAIKQLEKGGN